MNKILKINKIKKNRSVEELSKEVLLRRLLLGFLLCLFLFFTASLFCSVFADDFGVQGVTFPIAEPNFLQLLQARIVRLQQMGYFQKLTQALQSQVNQKVNQPQSVVGITTTRIPRSWFYDPSVRMPQTIYSPNGTRIVKAGQKYNPLQDVNLDEVLLFYNAEDPKQVAWARRMDQHEHGHDQLILVQGSIAQQLQQWQKWKKRKKPIYFDQWGELTTRFHITHVPALVKQYGLRLQVKECLP